MKIILRNKSNIFWTLMFPIILATFFNVAFSGINNAETFKPINIAIVENSNYQGLHFSNVIESLSKGNNRVFNTKMVADETKAKSELESNKIIGYYLVDSKINVIVKTSDIDETIMKTIADEYYQDQSIYENVMVSGKMQALEKLGNAGAASDYFKDITSSKKIDTTLICFYSLIGMMCLMAGFFGMDAVIQTEANLSAKGARISISPQNKITQLMSAEIAGFIVAYVELLIFFAFAILMLGLDFGGDIIQLLVLSFFATLAGISLGTFIGVGNKLSYNGKNALYLTITLTLSFLSGMMSPNIKYLIDQYFGFVRYISPVSMVNNALYSLYYYDTDAIFKFNIILLIGFILIMIFLSFMFLRRKRYDSI